MDASRSGRSDRAERAIAALNRLLPAHVTVFRNGVAAQLDARQLVPGDVIVLQEGDQVPADCRVIETRGMRVNEATVTGEAGAIDKDAGAICGEDLLASRNVVLAGTSVVAGAGQGACVRYRHAHGFGRIARLTQHTRAPFHRCRSKSYA